MLAGSKLLKVVPKHITATTTDQIEYFNEDGELDAAWIFAWYERIDKD